jgi:hypothetical protein
MSSGSVLGMNVHIARIGNDLLKRLNPAEEPFDGIALLYGNAVSILYACCPEEVMRVFRKCSLNSQSRPEHDFYKARLSTSAMSLSQFFAMVINPRIASTLLKNP